MAEQQKSGEIYSLIVPMMNTDLLVPNVSVAELVSMGQVDQPEEMHPEWFIGALDWRGERVPLISFEQANGSNENPITSQARVAILNTLTDDPEFPFLGIVVQGIPRLTHIKEQELTTLDSEDRGQAVASRVQYQNMTLDIPDLEYLQSLIN